MKNDAIKELLKSLGIIFIVVFGGTLAIGGGWALARKIINLLGG